MDTISCCIVGYGGISEFHAEALKKIECVRLHTVMGRRAEPAEAFAAKHSFEKSTIDYDTVINDPEVACIYQPPTSSL